MPTRTPTEHRAIVADIMSRAPANDSDIIPRKARPTASPRHAALAGEYQPLLAWRALTDAAAQDDVGTNWLADIASEVTADNDNLVDGKHRIRPSVEELMRCCEGVTFRDVPIGGRMEGGRVVDQDTIRVPASGDLEFGAERDATDGLSGQVMPLVRIGGLLLGEGRKAGHIIAFEDSRGRWWQPAEYREFPHSSIAPPARPSVCDTTERREANEHLARLRAALEPRHVRVLDLAISAANFTQIGESFACTGKTAERWGKRLVSEAVAALSAAIADDDTGSAEPSRAA